MADTPRHALPTLPNGPAYDEELELCLRIAAWLGERNRDDTPVSFTSLLSAILCSKGPVSDWFRSFAGKHQVTIPVPSRQPVDDPVVGEIIHQAESGALPNATDFYSVSTWNVLRDAVDVYATLNSLGARTQALGVRHVMASYGFMPLSDHLYQYEAWGFDLRIWRGEFTKFAEANYPDEPWVTYAKQRPAPPPLNSNLKAAQQKFENPNISAANPPPEFDQVQSAAGTAPILEQTVATRVASQIIGSFTADDPTSSRVNDALKVGDEAAAFARLVAAKDVRPPLAIGVFGEWGSGKTYFMRRMRESIDRITRKRANGANGANGVNGGDQAAPDPLLGDIVQIQFDAWHYVESNLWASLVEYIFAELDRWMLANSKSDSAGVELVFDRLATTQQLKLEALETVILRRSEKQTAETRAERTRKEYEKARERSEAVRPETYLRALLQTFVAQSPNAQFDRQQIAENLGLPELQTSAEQLGAALKDARTEAGRSRLLAKSMTAKLGSFGGALTALIVLLLFPLAAVWLKDLATASSHWEWLKQVQSGVLAVSTMLAGAAATLSWLVKRGRQGLQKLEQFDDQLRQQVEKQLAEEQQSDIAALNRTAQDALEKTRQAFEAAERALVTADANLLAARQDFESGTARARLNAFIRAKVTSGEYAKHLGIIAAIRRDFSQLASLMASSSDEAAEKAERDRLASDASARVDRFCDWMKSSADVRLTGRELEALLGFLAPDKALAYFDAKKDVLFKSHFEGSEAELAEVRANIEKKRQTSHNIPRFSRIVLYIDDLDRCPPEKVVQVLQAVHLLLSFPLFVVVVAVDARWVSRALQDRYSGLLADSPAPLPGEAAADAEGVELAARTRHSGGASSKDYLEKIFQIPYWVRPMDANAASDFVAGIASRDGAKKPPGYNLLLPVAPDPAVTLPGGPPQIAQTATPPKPPDIPGASGAPQAFEPPAIREPHSEDSENDDAPNDSLEGLVLDQHEIAVLRKYARYTGDTPRRALRFVNIYRLIKTSLPPKVRDGFVGVDGGSARYRALIAQLAIANGLPQTSAYFFDMLSDPAQDRDLSAIIETLYKNPEVTARADWTKLHTALQEITRESGSGLFELPKGWLPITLDDLKETALLARRYSFER